MEVLKGEVAALLPCEGDEADRLDDQLLKDGPDYIMAFQHEDSIGTPIHWQDLALSVYQSHRSIKKTSERNTNYERGTDLKKLGIGRHDLMSLQRAQKTLKELIASFRVEDECVGTHSCGAPEVRVCRVVVQSGGSLALPTGAFHSITTTSSSPSVYSYSFRNATLSVEEQRNRMTSHSISGDSHGKSELELTDETLSDESSSNTQDGQSQLHPKDLDESLSVEFPTFQDLLRFFKRKLALFWRSGRLLANACHCVLTNSCPIKV